MQIFRANLRSIVDKVSYFLSDLALYFQLLHVIGGTDLILSEEVSNKDVLDV